MKRRIVIAFLVFGGMTVLLMISRSPKLMAPESAGGRKLQVQKLLPAVTVTINSGGDIATFSGIRADTAYGALTNAAATRHIPVKSKQYDFGIFVQSIADKASGSDMSWIYFVNGKSGSVAADKRTLTEGDRIEWRYMKPQ